MLTPPTKTTYALANVFFIFGCIIGFIIKNNELSILSLILAYLILFSGNTYKGI